MCLRPSFYMYGVFLMALAWKWMQHKTVMKVDRGGQDRNYSIHSSYATQPNCHNPSVALPSSVDLSWLTSRRVLASDAGTVAIPAAKTSVPLADLTASVVVTVTVVAVATRLWPPPLLLLGWAIAETIAPAVGANAAPFSLLHAPG